MVHRGAETPPDAVIVRGRLTAHLATPTRPPFALQRAAEADSLLTANSHPHRPHKRKELAMPAISSPHRHRRRAEALRPSKPATPPAHHRAATRAIPPAPGPIAAHRPLGPRLAHRRHRLPRLRQFRPAPRQPDLRPPGRGHRPRPSTCSASATTPSTCSTSAHRSGSASRSSTISGSGPSSPRTATPMSRVRARGRRLSDWWADR